MATVVSFSGLSLACTLQWEQLSNYLCRHSSSQPVTHCCTPPAHVGSVCTWRSTSWYWVVEWLCFARCSRLLSHTVTCTYIVMTTHDRRGSLYIITPVTLPPPRSSHFTSTASLTLNSSQHFTLHTSSPSSPQVYL